MSETRTNDDLHAELRAMIEAASVWADDRFAQYGEITPMWHIVTGDGREMILQPPPVDKDVGARIMRAALRKLDAIRCVFIDEAWTVEVKLDDAAEVERIEREGAATHPRRVEMLMFAGEDQMGQLIGTRPIERPPGGKAYLGPIEIESSPVSHGRFVGMLPPRGARN
jgi:hypothetical protein